jgi:hypothetical protein
MSGGGVGKRARLGFLPASWAGVAGRLDNEKAIKWSGTEATDLINFGYCLPNYNRLGERVNDIPMRNHDS